MLGLRVRRTWTKILYQGLVAGPIVLVVLGAIRVSSYGSSTTRHGGLVGAAMMSSPSANRQPARHHVGHTARVRRGAPGDRWQRGRRRTSSTSPN
jgi:hypothetical protein